MRPATISSEDFKTAMQLDFETSKLWALYWQAQILTGAYKGRKKERGDSTSPTGWRQLTEEELLKDSLDTMQRHIHRMSELADNFKSEAHGPVDNGDL